VSFPPLERAIALIEQGKRTEAQKLLEALIAEDQHNVAAWLWLVETCTTKGQQLNVLEKCLESNPENQKVQLEVEKLRTLSAVQLSATLPKYDKKRPLSLLQLSVVSALILVAINFLCIPLSGNAFFICIPLAPFLSLPATAVVYRIYSSQHKGVFAVTAIGIPLIFNLLGASIILLVYWIPRWIDSLIHP